MIDLIMIHGGNELSPKLAKKSNWHYGIQHGYKSYGDVYMTDYTGDGSDFSAYIDSLKTLRPKLALVADFRHDDEWQMITDRMCQVAELGIIPVVVAKHKDSLRLIPHTVLGVKSRIGVSVPTAYMNDGFMPDTDEFIRYSSAKRDVHLLGGHPDQWSYLMQYYSGVANVASIDGNVLLQQARQYGKFWSRHGYYREMRGKGYSTESLTICSMKNTRRYLLRNWIKNSKRVQSCKIQLREVPKQLALAI